MPLQFLSGQLSTRYLLNRLVVRVNSILRLWQENVVRNRLHVRWLVVELLPAGS